MKIIEEYLLFLTNLDLHGIKNLKKGINNINKLNKSLSIVDKQIDIINGLNATDANNFISVDSYNLFLDILFNNIDDVDLLRYLHEENSRHIFYLNQFLYLKDNENKAFFDTIKNFGKYEFDFSLLTKDFMEDVFYIKFVSNIKLPEQERLLDIIESKDFSKIMDIEFIDNKTLKIDFNIKGFKQYETLF